MISHFFNFYGYDTQDGWTGREAQLKEAGYDDSKVGKEFGKGWNNNGDYPEHLNYNDGFIGRNEQLADIDSDLDIDNYELVYGEGYVKK